MVQTLCKWNNKAKWHRLKATLYNTISPIILHVIRFVYCFVRTSHFLTQIQACKQASKHTYTHIIAYTKLCSRSLIFDGELVTQQHHPYLIRSSILYSSNTQYAFGFLALFSRSVLLSFAQFISLFLCLSARFLSCFSQTGAYFSHENSVTKGLDTTDDGIWAFEITKKKPISVLSRTSCGTVQSYY